MCVFGCICNITILAGLPASLHATTSCSLFPLAAAMLTSNLLPLHLAYLQLKFPLTSTFNASKTAACVQLLPDPNTPGHLKPGALEPLLSVHDVEVRRVDDTDKPADATDNASALRGATSGIKKSLVQPRSKRAVATCRVARQGLWVVAQFDEAALRKEGAAGNGLSPELTATLGASLGAYDLIPGEFSDEDVKVDRSGECALGRSEGASKKGRGR